MRSVGVRRKVVLVGEAGARAPQAPPPPPPAGRARPPPGTPRRRRGGAPRRGAGARARGATRGGGPVRQRGQVVGFGHAGRVDATVRGHAGAIGGHGAFIGREVDGPWDVAEAVRAEMKAGATCIRYLSERPPKPVTASELQQAKAMLLREIPLSESSVDSIAGGWLYRASIGLPLDEPTFAARRYVALNAGQVEKAFAKWVRPEDLVQVTEGPRPH